MQSILSILLAVALGCALVYRFGGMAAVRPRWAGWLLTFGAGTLVGIAVTSCLFFLAVLIVPGVRHVALWLRLALTAGVIYECWRSREDRSGGGPKMSQGVPRSALLPLLWVAFAASLVAVTAGMVAAWNANPHGNWDAWSIWNLRAKFLVSGGLASRAWSPQLNFTHPEYPLLLSSFVASCWSDAGAVSTAAPIAAGYIFFLALLAMVSGGIAALRGPIAGVLAGMCLMGIPPLLHEAGSQYADVPLACFMAGALLFAVLDFPVISGALAGCAAWTKDEGVLFLLILLVAIAALKRSELLRWVSGVLPGAALVLIFRFGIAGRTHSALSGVAGSLPAKLLDFGRYSDTASAMVREIFAWNSGWYHPLLPLAVLLIAWRIDRRYQREIAFCGAVTLALVLGYFGAYIATPYELKWQRSTSLTRLFVQVAPLVLLTVFCGLRVPRPEAMAASPAPASKRAMKAKRKSA